MESGSPAFSVLFDQTWRFWSAAVGNPQSSGVLDLSRCTVEHVLAFLSRKADGGMEVMLLVVSSCPKVVLPFSGSDQCCED